MATSGIQPKKERATGAPRRLSRTEEARERLLALAKEMGPDAQLPPVRDLQERLGVSYSTLDAALSELERRRTIVRRHGSGIYVSSELLQRNIALICNPIHLYYFGESPFWRMMLRCAEELAPERGVGLTLHFARPGGLPLRMAVTPPDASQLNESLATEIVSGQIQGVLSIGLDHPTTRWIEQQGIPVVAFAGPANYIVTLPMSDVIQIGVVELARQGARRIGLWMPPSIDTTDGQRHSRTVFQGALAAQELPFFPEAVLPDLRLVKSLDDPALIGYRYAESLFLPDGSRAAHWPDAIISVDDMITQGALMSFQRRGVVIGRDIRIVTHANAGSPVLLGWLPSLTRIEYDPALVARTLFQTLMTLMDGQTPEASPVADAVPERHIVLRPRLIRPGAEDVF